MATYRVNGMTCGGCANAVTRAIKAAAPTAEVKVDLGAKTVSVTIEGGGQIAPEAVQAAVKDAGFEFLGSA